MTATLQAALAYRDAGLSLLPVKRDGTKAPDGRLLPSEMDPDSGKCRSTWTPFCNEPPTVEQIEKWFSRAAAPGIGVINGSVSGGLETLDFDLEAETLFPQWCDLVQEEAPGLVAMLSIAMTPKPGFHVRYRCQDVAIPGSTKLAMSDQGALIESKGTGGYAIAPGSPPEVHSTGRPYVHHSGPKLSQVQTITAAQREILLRCARLFDRSAAATASPSQNGHAGGLSPGDDFSARGPDWSEILTDWTIVRQVGGTRYWRRPGKDAGISATTGVCKNQKGQDLLAVFSSNAQPFEGPSSGRTCSVHTKFCALAYLQHGKDFKAATKVLASQGYGSRSDRPANDKQPETLKPAIRFYSAKELVGLELPEPKWAVEGILPEGMSLLAAKPKLGKSWLMLQMSLAIAAGGVALGVNVSRGKVLYLALEDTKRRLQSRLKKIEDATREPVSDWLTVATQWPRQDKGGLDELAQWAEANRDARLIVIDTWQKFRPTKTRGRDCYEEDYEHATQVKALADRFSIAINTTHHCRKLEAGDPLDEVSGTLGLTGAADGILVMKRERGRHDAALFVSGRDVEERELALKWDAQYCLWSVLGHADEYRLSKERAEVMDVLRQAGRPMGAAEVAPLVGKTINNVKQMLWVLWKENWLTNKEGKYVINTNHTN